VPAQPPSATCTHSPGAAQPPAQPPATSATYAGNIRTGHNAPYIASLSTPISLPFPTSMSVPLILAEIVRGISRGIPLPFPSPPSEFQTNVIFLEKYKSHPTSSDVSISPIHTSTKTSSLISQWHSNSMATCGHLHTTRRVIVILHKKKSSLSIRLARAPQGEQKSPDYVARQPFGQVPSIVHSSCHSFVLVRVHYHCSSTRQDDDGFILYESCHLATNYPRSRR
jgi:hypothetical protein